MEFPLREKQFRGRERVSATYRQLAHSRYLMKNLTGMAPQLEGQCFMPAITWAAGTVTVTAAWFRSFVTHVSPRMLMTHIFPRGYFLERVTKASAAGLFRSGTTGMYIILCTLDNGHSHYGEVLDGQGTGARHATPRLQRKPTKHSEMPLNT